MRGTTGRAEEKWMQRALRLASRGEGLASPNPMVGAVLVQDGQVVGEGYHLFARRDHAEVVALREAGGRAQGADLYVTLEPCCHQGRTPPCSIAVAAAGVRRVFVAVEDPNPLVAGKGIDFLRARGIDVQVGLCQDRATRLNESFFHFIRTGRPFVTLKLAMTLDGKIATAGGESKWITGPESRRAVQKLRFRSDAILVGIGTVLADDPSLDVRWRRAKSITKVILDSRLRCPEDARLFESGDPVVIFHGPSPSPERVERLGARAVLVAVERDDSLTPWERVLAELGRRSTTSLLVEGGCKVSGSLLAERQVNRVNFFYAPRILGAEGINGVGSLGLEKLADAVRLSGLSVRRLGEDFLVDGLVSER